MASPQNQRLRRAAEKASRRKITVAEKRKAELNTTVGREARQIEEAARGPINGALVSVDLFNTGIGYLVMARVLPSGSIGASIFLVDVWCLGVKDAFFRTMKHHKFLEFVEKTSVAQPLVKIDPPEARKLLRDAAAYAASLGLPPHKDYTMAEAIFGDVPVGETAFTFGHEGKPLFVAGPYDTPPKIKRIMDALARHKSEDHFNYIVPVDALPADITES